MKDVTPLNPGTRIVCRERACPMALACQPSKRFGVITSRGGTSVTMASGQRVHKFGWLALFRWRGWFGRLFHRSVICFFSTRDALELDE